LRSQNAADSNKYESVIEELKEKLRQMERDYIEKSKGLRLSMGSLDRQTFEPLRNSMSIRYKCLIKTYMKKQILPIKIEICSMRSSIKRIKCAKPSIYKF
jgi:hypothetical protein